MIETIAITVASVAAKQAATVVATKAFGSYLSRRNRAGKPVDQSYETSIDDILSQMDKILEG